MKNLGKNPKQTFQAWAQSLLACPWIQTVQYHEYQRYLPQLVEKDVPARLHWMDDRNTIKATGSKKALFDCLCKFCPQMVEKSIFFTFGLAAMLDLSNGLDWDNFIQW